jgi:large subunit ribosomal protein L18e
MVIKGPENVRLLTLIRELRSAKKKFWKRVAHFLSKPRRQRITVNLSKINRYGKEGKIIVVPGKVLGDSQLSLPLTVVAFKFSKRAKEEIERAGGRALLLDEYYKQNGDNVKDVVILI